MVSIGVVALWDRALTFQATMAPISDRWEASALAVCEVTRQEHLDYPEPKSQMAALKTWLLDTSGGAQPKMWSDNPAFDWQFINYYFHQFLGENPCGFSARRIGDFASGLYGEPKDHSSWKKLRETEHTHDPLDDALGNAEALEKLWSIANEKGQL